MHPTIAYELAKMKIEEDKQSAARQRLVRAVSQDRPRTIDFASLGRRLRVRLGAGSTFGRPSATSNA
jgi:hypothetical protein